jgi:hypothetical protein
MYLTKAQLMSEQICCSFTRSILTIETEKVTQTNIHIFYKYLTKAQLMSEQICCSLLDQFLLLKPKKSHKQNIHIHILQ